MSAPRRRLDTERVTTAIRFTPTLHDQLKTISRDTELSINWLVNRAVTEFVERIRCDDRSLRLPVSDSVFDEGDGPVTTDWVGGTPS